MLRCLECEKLFNAQKALHDGENVFCGEGCREQWEKKQKHKPTMAEFLEGKDGFLEYVNSVHKEKPGTRSYYQDGTNMILKCEFASERIDKITDQNAQQFAAKFSHLSPSRINCGLRTLRRALNLAYEWGKLERPAKITLAKGERQRDRVLTDAEWQQYISECPQPWKDAATIIRGTGMRPGEVFELRWENVHLNGNSGQILVAKGKTRAARRVLPMVPAVYQALKSRYEATGKPEAGWVFPATSKEGHLNKNAAKDMHKRAIDRANENAKAYGLKPLKWFQPYCLRHTALTRLAESGVDAFTVMRIAGHSSITITQRYIHPQADAVERAFQRVRSEMEKPLLVTNLGTNAENEKSAA